MWMGMGSSSNDEWLELKNNTKNNLSLSNCHIIKKNGDDIVKNTDLKDKVIQENDFFVISYKSKEDSEINVSTNQILSYQALSNTALEIKLLCDDVVIDTAGDGNTPPYGENGTIKKSMERDADGNTWHTCYEAAGLDDDSSDLATPGYENSQKPAAKKYDGKIVLSEIFPHPEDGDEYIELKNQENDPVNIESYVLRDSSASGKFIFPSGAIIKDSGYFAIYKEDFKFALNDSGGETVSLYDPNGKLIDRISYSSSKKNYSFSFDGSSWRWTKYLTPEKENEFEKILDGKIKMSSEIYTNVYADFEVKAKGEVQKFKWNFGDGHRSSLKKTRHKYEESGIYNASVGLSGDGEENVLYFTVKVENYSAPKVKIIKLVPNPKGNDSKEYIEIKNKSKEKINLKGWSVATGWKSLVNHPIREDFVLKPGKTKKLTKKICAFTLGNAQTKIELRYPDGETAQKLKYNREKDKISDDETFELNGKNWLWNKPQTDADDEKSNPENEAANEQAALEGHPESNSEEIKEDIEIKIDELEMKANLGKFSENGGFVAKRQNRIQLVGYATKINTPEFVLGSPGKVAGAYTEKIIRLEEKHWVFQITDTAWTQINSKINKILNKI